MPSIVHELVLKAPRERVFQAMVTPEGLARWWTKASEGQPQMGAEYRLFFGPEFDWQGRVTRYEPDSAFELAITKADSDWIGTRVRFELEADGAKADRFADYMLVNGSVEPKAFEVVALPEVSDHRPMVLEI